MYLSVVFIAFLLFGLGFLLLKSPFFKLAENTLKLLNIVLDSELDDDAKQKELISKVTPVISALLILFVLIGLIVVVTSMPFYIFSEIESVNISQLDYSSWKFFVTMIIGTTVPFVLTSFKKSDSDYTDWSKLLHRLILNNYNISKMLFNMERKKVVNQKENERTPDEFVIVTGLARAGTTALTKTLYKSNKFYSLSYANMPFLLAPNIWKKFYNPKNAELKERAHGDKVQFGFDTIEALEEHFYKCFLKDSFIKENCLEEHTISKELYQKYVDYQKIIGWNNSDGKVYLSKNNNFLLRYNSLRKYNSNFKVILLFRKPVDHAYSLLNQHKRFMESQQHDPFVLEYMDWLGHHEFGLHEKHFNFKNIEIDKDNNDKLSIEYWLKIWLNYYQKVLELIDDNNIVLIPYEKFCTDPNAVLAHIKANVNIDFDINNISPFEPQDYTVDGEANLISQAQEIYQQLLTYAEV